MFIELISDGLKAVPNQNCMCHLTGKFTKLTEVLSPLASFHLPSGFHCLEFGS